MEPIGDPGEDSDFDFADEHDETTVDPDVSNGDRNDGETESPDGWDGLDQEGPP